MYLSAFVDFINVFIRYRSKPRTSELSAMAAKMVSTKVFFPQINYSCATKISINSVNFAQSLHSHFLNSIRVSFHVIVWPVWLIRDNLHLPLHVSYFLLVCTLIFTGKPSRQHFSKFKNEILRKGVETPEQRQCFLMSCQ